MAGNPLTAQMPVGSNFRVPTSNQQPLDISVELAPVTPTADQTVWVSKGGDDANGTGSDELPFLTIAAAQAAIIDASTSKRYALMLAPGAYTENVLLKPNVFIVGVQANICRIDGNVALDASWGGTANNRGGLDNLVVVGDTVLDFVGLGASNGFFFGQYPFFLGNFNVIGDSAGNFLSLQNAFLGLGVLLDGGQYELVMPVCDNFTNWTIRGATNQTVVFLEGGVCNGSGLITSHFGTSVLVLNYGFCWAGSFTLDGANSQIFAQQGDLPSNIIISGGAVAPFNADVVLQFDFPSGTVIAGGVNTFPINPGALGVLDTTWSNSWTLFDDAGELAACTVTAYFGNGTGTLRVNNPGAGFNTGNDVKVNLVCRKVL
jgi:hypothetical protein